MIERLSLSQFRNIESLSYEANPFFNVILGANGSGKTSFLEAIYFLSHGRSFRSSRFVRMIRHEQDQFTLFGQLEQEGQTHKIGLERMRDGSGQLKVDGKAESSHSPAARLLPTLLFNPESFSQFWSSSKVRRPLIDWGLFYQQPEFLGVWQKLSRALKQRNAALRIGQNRDMVTLWDPAILELSEQLNQQRLAYVKEFLPVVESLLPEFLKDHRLSISFYQGWSADKSLAECLEEGYERDAKLGYTYYGPQRADLRFKIGAASAQDILSRGQQKLLICSLKLAQGMVFSKTANRPCVYLLDDLCSELDLANQEKLFSHLKTMKAQVFVTAIEPDRVSSLLEGTDASFLSAFS